MVHNLNVNRLRISMVLVCASAYGQQYAISTVAGDGVAGAFLNNPTSIAVDAAGDLFVADWSAFIRKIWVKDRATTTIAGNGVLGYGGDGGQATNAMIAKVSGMAVDTAGKLYLTDGDNNRIRVVDSFTGLIATVAGTGSDRDSGDGGLALDAGIVRPTGLVIDPTGNLFFSSSWSRIRKLTTATGTIETIAGRLGNGLTDGPALEAFFWGPVPSAISSDGDVYIADHQNSRIRVLKSQTATVHTFAGSGNCPGAPPPFGIPVCRGGFAGDGGPAASSSLHHPSGVAIDTAGNLYIADTRNHRIRRVDAATHRIETIAGTGSRGFSGDGGAALAAELSFPSAIAVDVSGRVYFSDFGNNRIRVLTPSTASIHMVQRGHGRTSKITGRELPKQQISGQSYSAPVRRVEPLRSASR
jgi:streptogramin lyase